MNKEYHKWILSQKEFLKSLAKTKFYFLDYVDLIYTNSLFDKLDKIEQKRIDRKPIPNWHYYQIEAKELTKEDFFDFFFTDVNASELVFLITDEGHDKGWVFRFYINEFMTFSKWYEEYFNRDFFQFSDYLVVFPSLNRIRVIDDEGGINEIDLL